MRPFREILEIARARFRFLGVHEVAQRPAAQLVEQIAEHLLHRAVGVDDAPGEIEAGDADERRFEDGAEAFLAFEERVLGALALGDVAEVQDDRRARPIRRGD